jgi:[amino group carrier protein]-lysine/ornithine hydrolase
VYGPGDSALDHAPDEHIELADYARAVNVLSEVLGRLSAEKEDKSLL